MDDYFPPSENLEAAIRACEPHNYTVKFSGSPKATSHETEWSFAKVGWAPLWLLDGSKDEFKAGDNQEKHGYIVPIW